MGFAILWVITFHYDFLEGTPIDFLFKNGFLGVDIFISLSAFGLCFSLSKESNYIRFLKKRVIRIIPTWWIIITLMLLVAIVLGRMNYPHTLLQYICYYSGLGWWFFYEQPYGIYYYEWYIPTLLAFYIITPFIYKQSNKTLFIGCILTAIVGFLLSYFKIAEALRLSYLRIPTLIYGVILYRLYMMQKQGTMNYSNKIYLYVSSVIGSICVIMNFIGIVDWQLCILIYSFVLSLPIFCYLVVVVFEKMKLTKILSFIGGMTLELYLLHIYNIPLGATMYIIENRTIAIFIVVLLLIGISYFFQKMLWYISHKINYIVVK